MLVYIQYNLTDAATGGGNQFIKSVKKCLLAMGCITDNVEDADIILFNGHQESHSIQNLKNKYPNKKFIHRLDGLQKIYNQPNDSRQDQALAINKIADGTIFQSIWARNNFEKFGFDLSRKQTVIYNAPDKSIFYERFGEHNNTKIRLITTNWSSNMKKGFKYYQHLDKNLDFGKYEYWFIGNSPVDFINIKMFEPQTSLALGYHLRNSDIFVSGVEHDACSNSILEALGTGLPVVALNSGGTPELIGKGGELFEGTDDVIDVIEKVSLNKEEYSENINIDSIEQIAVNYLRFFEECL